jgi:hypothetical protein
LPGFRAGLANQRFNHSSRHPNAYKPETFELSTDDLRWYAAKAKQAIDCDNISFAIAGIGTFIPPSEIRKMSLNLDTDSVWDAWKSRNTRLNTKGTLCAIGRVNSNRLWIFQRPVNFVATAPHYTKSFPKPLP